MPGENLVSTQSYQTDAEQEFGSKQRPDPSSEGSCRCDMGILTRFGTDRFAPPGISIRVPMRYLSRENSLCQAADLVLGDRTGKEALGCPGDRGGLFTLSS